MTRPRISAGDLRHRITLQQRGVGQNPLGGPNGAWGDWQTVWAKPEPLRSRELFAAGQMQSSVDTRFSIRYLAGVLPTMRVVWEGRAYDLVGEPIDVDGGKHTLELICASGVRDAR